MRRISTDIWRLAGAFGLLLTTAASLPPKDECAAEPGFAAFRTELQDIVARRDSAKLMTLLAPEISNGFSGDDGPIWFRKIWMLDEVPPAPSVWTELSALLALGCAKGDGWLAMPYLYQRVPDEEDPFDVLVAIGSSVALRAAPSDDSPLVATLDWEILKTENAEAPEPWIKVRTGSGATGFVRRPEVRSPIDYRALFERKSGKWFMTALLAGD